MHKTHQGLDDAFKDLIQTMRMYQEEIPWVELTERPAFKDKMNLGSRGMVARSPEGFYCVLVVNDTANGLVIHRVESYDSVARLHERGWEGVKP